MMLKCSVEGCETGGKMLRGMCLKHYRRWKKHGDPLTGFKGHLGLGRRKHPLYPAWAGMINRCHNPNNSSYHRYGAMGVIVCDRWREDFLNFLADMGERPEGKTLDRFPNNLGNYEPGNCRWATAKEQRANLSEAGEARMREAARASKVAFWDRKRAAKALEF